MDHNSAISWRIMPRFLGVGAVLATLGCFVLVTPAETVGQPPPLRQAESRNFDKLQPPAVPYEAGPVIPGLQAGAVPQGLAFSAKHDRLFISHYAKDGPSLISIIDSESGKLTASVALKETAEKFHQGHVGGIALLGETLWVASDGKLWQYALAPFVAEEPPASVIPLASRECETRASFCTATGDRLFVGEYAYRWLFPTDESHHTTDRKGVKKRTWVCGYAADDLSGQPTCVLPVRQKVQGMCFAGDRVFLSVSYGRKNRSKIVEYRNPLGEAAHSQAKLSDGAKVPLWFLDGANFVREIDFPPMSEGITMIGNRLAVLSESGAAKYQKGGRGPLDRVLLLEVRGEEE